MAKLSFVQIKPLDPFLRDKSRGLCHFHAELLGLLDAQAAAFHRESETHGFAEQTTICGPLTFSFLGICPREY